MDIGNMDRHEYKECRSPYCDQSKRHCGEPGCCGREADDILEDDFTAWIRETRAETRAAGKS
jgi:hypothetical protein